MTDTPAATTELEATIENALSDADFGKNDGGFDNGRPRKNVQRFIEALARRGLHIEARTTSTAPPEHGPNDGCAELLWAHVSADPGFDEELRQAEADLAEGRGVPFKSIEAEASRPPVSEDHPRTYSLVGTPHLFLVTDDESGINIGYAKQIGGPLVAPPTPSIARSYPGDVGDPPERSGLDGGAK